MTSWMRLVLFQLLLVSRVSCSIDGIITAVEEEYLSDLDDPEGKSLSVLWYDYQIPGSNDTFVKFQLDQLVTKETYERVVDQEGGGLPRRRRHAVNDVSMLWPAGRVPYKLDDNFSDEDEVQISLAIQHWMAHTCIVFEPATADDFNMITFRAVDNVCESVVGMMQGNQPISLAKGCRTRDVVIHEIGHALGLFHEHMRYDRDKYVTINYKNINESLHYNFRKVYSHEYNDYGKPYDYRSIMHYSKYAFSTDRSRNLTTIVPTDQSFLDIIGTVTEASFLDFQIVNAMYNCSAGCRDKNCPVGSFHGKQCLCYCNNNGTITRCNETGLCRKPQIDQTLYNVYLRDFREILDLDQRFLKGTILLAEFKDRACGDNYTRLTCIDGEWRGEVPKCLEEKSCAVKSAWMDEYIIELGHIDETGDLSDKFTEIQDEDYILSRHIIRVSCMKYPKLNNVLTCESGKWSDAPVPCAIEECKVKYASESLYSLHLDGERLKDGAAVPHGTQVLASCDNPDYDRGEMFAQTNMTCNNSVWVGDLPQNCPEARCKKPQIDQALYDVYLRDFQEILDLDQRFLKGTILLIAFKDRACGYHITNSTCIDGEWRGEVPKCLEEKSCAVKAKWIDEYTLEDLGQIEETGDLSDNYTVIQGEDYILSKHSIRVTCIEYPVLSNVMTCESGKWSDAPLPCVMKDCKVKYASESLHSLYMVGKRLTKGTDVLHGTQVFAFCNNPNSGGGEMLAETNITCNNGVWEGDPPQNCPKGRKDCRLVVNATVIGSFLSGYSVTCIHGYNITVPDTKTFRCSHIGEWEPARPYCKPADCVLSLNESRATVTNHVGKQLSSGSVIKHGNNVTLRCPHGSYPDVMITTCGLGNWSTETGQLPHCKQVNCPKPSVTKVRYKPDKQNYVYKDIVVVNKCRRNLQFFGDKKLTCQQHGNWSGKAGCRKYCGKGVESYIDWKNKIIRGKPQKVIQLGRFSSSLCKRQCSRQKRFLCMSVVYGFNERRRRFECRLHKADPTKNEKIIDKSFWTLANRTCKSIE